MKVSSTIAERGHEYYIENLVRYISIDGNRGYAIVEGSKGYEVEFEYENGVLTCLIENDDVFMMVNFEKLPLMEDEEEEEEKAAVVPEVPEVPEVITLDEVIQEGGEIEEEPIPFQLVEDKPLFMGGDANQFSKWVNERLVYPDIAKENGVQGRVVLQFTVAKDGSIKNVRVLRGVDPALDNEAVRVVSMSPAWTPGMQRGRVVPVTYTFPVIFQLN